MQTSPRRDSDDTVDKALCGARRLIVAHNGERAREQTALRRQRIAELEARAAQRAGKLDAQETGQLSRGRKLYKSLADVLASIRIKTLARFVLNSGFPDRHGTECDWSHLTLLDRRLPLGASHENPDTFGLGQTDLPSIVGSQSVQGRFASAEGYAFDIDALVGRAGVTSKFASWRGAGCD